MSSMRAVSKVSVRQKKIIPRFATGEKGAAPSVARTRLERNISFANLTCFAAALSSGRWEMRFSAFFHCLQFN